MALRGKTESPRNTLFGKSRMIDGNNFYSLVLIFIHKFKALKSQEVTFDVSFL